MNANFGTYEHRRGSRAIMVRQTCFVKRNAARPALPLALEANTSALTMRELSDVRFVSMTDPAQRAPPQHLDARCLLRLLVLGDVP